MPRNRIRTRLSARLVSEAQVSGLRDAKDCVHVVRPYNHRGRWMMRCVLCHTLREAQISKEESHGR